MNLKLLFADLGVHPCGNKKVHQELQTGIDKGGIGDNIPGQRKSKERVRWGDTYGGTLMAWTS